MKKETLKKVSFFYDPRFLVNRLAKQKRKISKRYNLLCGAESDVVDAMKSEKSRRVSELMS